MINIYSRTWLLLLTLATSPALFATEETGRNITLQGNGKGAIACISCHGRAGEGTPEAGYPYLAGLPADYIRNQLVAFSSGDRHNIIMQQIASKLSIEDIAAVASYYAGMQNSRIEKATTTRSSKYKRGSALAHDGKWQSGLPACFKCHGEEGKGVPPHFPPIVGQPSQYLQNQLLAWKNGGRHNDPLGLMQAVSAALSKDDIDAVARYLAAQPEQQTGANQ